ncbi:hypothetical protein BHE74_00056375 [Ensete ventricosum]|nr:hypothetical protein GW17_00015154 [Ensete ventricosum]RWW38394.1 hypothetical protein BHE74_00056375 [Ensete ventricosum]RZS28789.1 hypothetical protein BHM03_00062466 [Ensete ventricosum]
MVGDPETQKSSTRRSGFVKLGLLESERGGTYRDIQFNGRDTVSRVASTTLRKVILSSVTRTSIDDREYDDNDNRCDLRSDVSRLSGC